MVSLRGENNLTNIEDESMFAARCYKALLDRSCRWPVFNVTITVYGGRLSI